MGECLILKSGSGSDTSNANATADTILQGYSGYVNDVLVHGAVRVYDENGPKQTELSPSDTRPVYVQGDAKDGMFIIANGDGVERLNIKVPNTGYYKQTSIVAINVDTWRNVLRNRACRDANCVNGHILTGYRAWGSTGLAEGSIVNRGAIAHALPINGHYTIPAGWHSGGGYVNQSIPVQGGWTITPSTYNILCTGAWKYVSGNITVVGNANLVPWIIKKGVWLFGVLGTWQGY